MAYKFLGIMPNTGKDDSPTMWLHEETGDVLCQSYKATREEIEECQEVGSIPGHSTEVPEHETIIRIPKAMLQFIPRQDGEAADAAPGT